MKNNPDILYSESEFRLTSGIDEGTMWLIRNTITREWIMGGNQTILVTLDRYTELLLDAQLEGLTVGPMSGGAQ
jgi:hypothetical protein